MTEEYRSDAALVAGERTQIEAFLHDNRRELAGLLDGLTEEQARRRQVPSVTTLLGLVKHAAYVERSWFELALAGRSRAEVGLREVGADSFALTEHDTIASVLADYRRAWADADRTAAAYGLDDLALHNRRGPLSLRWILLHLIEEPARHAGHGDILREQILAAAV